MTRQKKEILKEIDEIRLAIAADEELGCGCAPPGAYDSMYERIYELETQLAKLSHYDSAEDMFHDDRWMKAQVGSEPLPFE